MERSFTNQYLNILIMFDNETILRTICTSCGKYLTNAEEEDPCIIKRYFMDEWYVEDIVCDSCASELNAI